MRPIAKAQVYSLPTNIDTTNPGSIFDIQSKTIPRAGGTEGILCQFTITASAGAHGSIAPPGVTSVNNDSNLRYTITPNSGYHVADVLVDGFSAGPVTSYIFTKVTSNHTISASFAANTVKTFTLTVTATNGTITKAPNLAAYDSNSTVQLTATPAMGYHFTGWSGDLSGTINPVNVIMDANKNITANFAINMYTLTVNATSGSVTKVPDLATYEENAIVQLTATPATGYHFTGWSGDLNGTTNPVNVTMDANKNITASFTINTIKSFTLTVNATNGSVAKVPDRAAYDSNSTVQLTATPATGYHFTGWSGDLNGTTNPVNVIMDANKNITASFEMDINTYAITATAGPHGSVTPAGVTLVNSGGSQNYIFTPEAHYHIDSVLIDGISAGPVPSYLFTIVTSNHTINARFTIDTYTITTTAGSNGSITPAGTVTIDYGDSLLFTITHNFGYLITDVLVDGNSVGAVASYKFTNVSTNHTISASFERAPYTITATVGDNGSITPTGVTTVLYGDDLIYTIEPSTGYKVDNVFVDDVSVGAVTSYEFTDISDNHTIRAIFGCCCGPIGETTISVYKQWNLVSVPRCQANYTPGIVFRGRSNDVFGYNTGTRSYEAKTTLAHGEGYWVYYAADDTVTMYGPEKSTSNHYCYTKRMGSRGIHFNASTGVLAQIQQRRCEV